MGSEWAKEAERQAEAMTREVAALSKGARVMYQRREARFALKAGGDTAYFPAHNYEKRRGMDWAQLRKDVLSRAKEATAQDPGGRVSEGDD